MDFILVLVVTTALVWLLRKPIKKAPLAFYALTILFNIAYIATLYVTLPELAREAIFLLMQKCTLALALFTVVMYIGVFGKDSKVSHELRPIRSELSIMACLLAIGHMVVYLTAFLPRIMAGVGMAGNFMLFFATAVALLILLIVLGVTSFAFVKRHMSAQAWIKLQKWAYVFFGLIYVHLVSILLPSALNGGTTALVSIGVYTVLFGAYAVLRVYRAMADKKAASAPAAEETPAAA